MLISLDFTGDGWFIAAHQKDLPFVRAAKFCQQGLWRRFRSLKIDQKKYLCISVSFKTYQRFTFMGQHNDLICSAFFYTKQDGRKWKKPRLFKQLEGEKS